MLCPNCGWEMRLINHKQYNLFKDSLYKCKCGATHLEISAAKDRKQLIPIQTRTKLRKKALI
ncbi:MAG TPA: hypothetical protein ENN38_02550 [Actinobacteria bacterium]|nr:hypothetical protein [Actinomycetota bacterium]